MQCIAGIDVSSQTLDVYIADSDESSVYTADASGRRALIRRLVECGVKKVVLEATGGYERQIMLEVVKADIAVQRVNGRDARRFAQAAGFAAKTDSIDARMLVAFALALPNKGGFVPDETIVACQELLARRDQLIKDRTSQRCRLKQALDSRVQSSIKRHLEAISELLDEIEVELDECLKSNAEWTYMAGLLRTQKGVGPVLARRLLIDLPELGRVNRGRIARIVGIAPLNDDTGLHRGKRRVIGGRADVRKTLFMATLTATRFNPTIKAHYKHLIERGKCHKVAMVACMRKFIIILNAIVRDDLQSRGQLN